MVYSAIEWSTGRFGPDETGRYVELKAKADRCQQKQLSWPLGGIKRSIDPFGHCVLEEVLELSTA